ncbi:MAG: ATP-binding protein [Candidatus Daviesbacteria bacterium]|nr:ATP-binding protein [Candidatus Daviesbacteria bacterium]
MQFNFLKDIQERNKAKQQAVKFNVGGQDQVDLISYSGLEEQSSYLVLGNKVVRTLFVSGYPYTASTGWLSMLINFNHNVDISYHIEHIDPILALPKLNRKITELESTKRSMQQSGKIIGSEILDPLDSAIELKNKIQRGQEKLFQISIYITITADSLIELNKITTLLETVLSTRLFYSKTATFQQLEGLQSVLPRAENQLNQKRNLDSSSTALTFPFTSSELVQESGILYGVNKSNNSLVMIDRFSLNNSNSITFAQSGSGKSYIAKVEILRHLMQGTKVIVIDPEREYKRLAESVGGTYIKLSVRSKEKINPFDFSLSSNNEEGNGLPEHIQDLTELVSLLADGLTPEEKAVVDKAIIQTYKQFHHSMKEEQVNEDIHKKGRKKKVKRGRPKKIRTYPMLKDLYSTLRLLGQKKLCTRLTKYIKGSLSGVFDEQTNIELNNRLVVFDIKDLSESLRQIMMFVVASFVFNQVKKDPVKRMLVIDEGWMLLKHEETANFIAGLARRARKYYLGVSVISQQANDFLSNEYGKAIASQSSLRVLMRQDTTTIKKVAEEFNLSEYEQKFLLSCDRGEALIIADQNHVALKVVASESEHPLITTNPAEKIVLN